MLNSAFARLWRVTSASLVVISTLRPCKGFDSLHTAASISGSATRAYSSGGGFCMGGNCFSSTADMSNDSVVIPASAKHTATVIFMHGLGDTGNGWSPVMEQIKQPHIKYICPHAPIQPVTLNMGMQMPSWFDIKALSIEAEQDKPGIEKASKIVQTLIEEEIKSGVDSQRIIIGGFSQGGALSLYTAFTYDKPLAAVIALSCWLPLHKELLAGKRPFQHPKPANSQVSVLQCHGDADPLAPVAVGQVTSQILKSFNPNCSFKLYPGMGHSACDQEIKDIRDFINKTLPPL